MSPDQWPDVGEDAGEIVEAGDAHTGEGPDPYHETPELSDAVWALWGQVHLLRQELESDRVERQRDGAAMPAAVAQAIAAVFSGWGEPHALTPGSGGAAVPFGLASLAGDVERIHAALLADRAERQRFETSLVSLVRREVERALAQEIGGRELGVAGLQEALRAGLEVLRTELRAIERHPVGAEGTALTKVVRAALDELRVELAEERAQREAREALYGAALDEVAGALQALRQAAVDAEKAADARQVAAESQQANALGAWYDAVREEVAGGWKELEELRQAVAAAHAAADDRHTVSETQQVRSAAAIESALKAVRDELTKQVLRSEALADLVAAQRGQLNELQDERSRDRQLGEERDAAGAAARQAVQARLAELQEALGASASEAGAERTRRQAWEAGLGGALATLHAELAQSREELAALQSVFAETRRDQEALAFELADAKKGMEDDAAQALAGRVETLRQLEAALRATLSGADEWFAHTRDELVERLDQLAAAADLGIAESMVTVLEQVRSEIEGVRQELAALGRRQNLTAAQVRKILREAGANGTPEKAVRPAKSRSPSRRP